jgi:glycerate dehydrogenase
MNERESVMKAVGIDIGTTTVCGIVMDIETGKVLEVRTLSNNSVIQRESFARLQDPAVIWSLVHKMYQEFTGLFTDVSRRWNELSGMSIGIVGLGNIGRKVANIAEAFGMKVSYFSTSGTSHCSDYPSLPLERILAESDIISIHAPLNDRTRGLIGRKELAMMKKDAILINMGRGGIVDEQSLADAIDEGLIAGAALDVFTVEPLPESHPFLNVKHPERLLLSPHVAWASVQARERLVGMIAENIVSFVG